MIDVTLLSRSPAAGRHFSIERVVGDVVGVFPDDVRARRVEVPRRGVSPRAMLENCRFARRVRGDIVHLTGDVHYVLPFVPRPARRVLTVHDLASLHRARGLRRRLIRLWWYVLPFRAADVVTTVSEETAADVRREFPRLSTPIVVVENPVSSCFRPPSTPRVPGRRVLAIGTAANKNLPVLIEALAGSAVELRIVGELQDDQLALLRRHGIDWSATSSLGDEELAAEYHAADVLAFVSLSEGFGLPIVEAQASGLPVVTSDRPPMNRVAGEGAVLVDATDVGAVRTAIAGLLDDAVARAHLVSAGFANVTDRRPEAVARRYADVFRGLVALRP